MPQIDRRTFLTASAAWLACAATAHAFWPLKGKQSGAGIRGRVARGDAPATPGQFSHEAYAYKKLDNQYVVCQVCPHHCMLSPGDRSVCRSKANIDGTLYTLAYGNPCAVHVDPVEKKPLYHFLPGIRVFPWRWRGAIFAA